MNSPGTQLIATQFRHELLRLGEQPIIVLQKILGSLIVVAVVYEEVGLSNEVSADVGTVEIWTTTRTAARCQLKTTVEETTLVVEGMLAGVVHRTWLPKLQRLTLTTSQQQQPVLPF